MTSEIIEGEVVGREVATVDAPPPALFGTTDPDEVVAKATRTATALAGVVRQRQLYSDIGGKEYVRCEGWTLLGSMLGVFPVEDWTRPLENGWEARVEARTMNGQVIGAAEAMCTRDEKRWKTADEYAIRSMAQTRATAKALRMPLGFVMHLAGYQVTPAEEMTFAKDQGWDRAPASATPKPSCPTHGLKTISFVKAGTSKKGKPFSAFWSCSKECGWTKWDEDWLKELQLATGTAPERTQEEMDVPFDE
jgi:hypothetical protein